MKYKRLESRQGEDVRTAAHINIESTLSEIYLGKNESIDSICHHRYRGYAFRSSQSNIILLKDTNRKEQFIPICKCYDIMNTGSQSYTRNF